MTEVVRAEPTVHPAQPLLFPSDVRDGRTRIADEEQRIAGRVLLVQAETLVIADAFASLRVRCSTHLEVNEGDWVIVRGQLGSDELSAARLEFHQSAPAPHGSGEVGRFVFSGVGTHLAARARALREVRDYFQDRGFTEVETPWRVPAPGVDLHVEAFRADAGYLITSPELEMKRLLVGGVPKQFQFARVSRADEAGRLHEAEFTLLEWYRAFTSYEAVQEDTEAIVRRVATRIGANGALTTPTGRRVAVEQTFERITVSEAFRTYAGVTDVSELAQRDEARYFELLIEQVEPALSRCERPIFLVEYPISQAALAQPCAHDARFAERFELYAGGVELCNGYGELTCPKEQRRRFEAEQTRRRDGGLQVYPINERFLSALAEGMPPSAGNALGFDRLLMLALGARRIQDVMAFPRERA
ncbi:MAG TPA: EF-P lysine aminoacylase EpmA [Polyangiaceae bacterium]|nr:EF-P lysine aminoacylase EpmA [Polyangiaceae bacterium]